MFGKSGIATHPSRKQGPVGDDSQVCEGGQRLKHMTCSSFPSTFLIVLSLCICFLLDGLSSFIF